MTKRMIAAQLSVGALLLVLVALMESYTDSEYWNLDSIVARVKAYLGES